MHRGPSTRASRIAQDDEEENKQRQLQQQIPAGFFAALENDKSCGKVATLAALGMTKCGGRSEENEQQQLQSRSLRDDKTKEQATATAKTKVKAAATAKAKYGGPLRCAQDDKSVGRPSAN